MVEIEQVMILFLAMCNIPKAVQPTHQAAFVGETVSMKCYSYSIPKWKSLNTRKYKVAKRTMRCKSRIYVYELYVFDATVVHSGKYTCHGTKKSGESFEAISYLYIGCKYSTVIGVTRLFYKCVVVHHGIRLVSAIVLYILKGLACYLSATSVLVNNSITCVVVKTYFAKVLMKKM